MAKISFNIRCWILLKYPHSACGEISVAALSKTGLFNISFHYVLNYCLNSDRYIYIYYISKKGK